MMSIELWKAIVVSVWLVVMICVGIYYSKKQDKTFKEVFYGENRNFNTKWQ